MTYEEWLSSGGCYCSAINHPPCSWCESTGSYTCTCCGEEFLDYAFFEDQDVPMMCPSCMTERSFLNPGIEDSKFFQQDLSFYRALDCLKNKDLEKALKFEYNKHKPTNINKFLQDLLSPDLAGLVIGNLNNANC